MGLSDIYKAAENGHLECLKYADKHDCGSPITEIYDSYKDYQYKFNFRSKHDLNDIIGITKINGHIECAKILEKIICVKNT